MNWPSSIGLDPLLINQGEIRNRGIEIQANWNDRVNKDFPTSCRVIFISEELGFGYWRKEC